MLEEILDSPATPVVTFLIGLVVGHWLAVHRDKRKEYNELVAPIRQKIAAETRYTVPHRAVISRDEADAVWARMNLVSRFHFLKACERYWQAQEEQYQDELGQPLYVNPDAVRDAAQYLRKKIPIR